MYQLSPRKGKCMWNLSKQRLGQGHGGRLLLAVVALLATGCASVLPNESSHKVYPWATFDEVQKAYNSVELEKTTLADLKTKGFDPESIPNVTVLSYLDVVNRFSPILDKSDLPHGVQKCIIAREKCVAYVASPANINKERVGNVALDLLGFRKETKVTGWRFDAVFVMVDNVVVYKLWSGTPDIEEYEKRMQPLGPAQNIGNLFAPN